jgi:hypothetical protein
MDGTGRLIESRFVPWRTEHYVIYPSPAGAYAAGHYLVELSPHRREFRYRFVDIAGEKIVGGVVTAPKQWWWQDNNTFGWIDSAGKRHLMKVGP